VNKHTLKLVAIVRLAGDHIDAFHEADAEVLEAVEDALSSDILEDTRNTQARNIRGKRGQVNDLRHISLFRRHFRT
jgi:hypothetical protein